jgi:6-pyruvoyltetrahydropterin/6-carboxytetrahydropterin synthase
MLTVTKCFEFAYAHYLPKYTGKCKNLHGHTGILEVEIAKTGGIEKLEHYEGMVLDFSYLKEIVTQLVISKFDHACLNDILPIPTAENMVQFAVDELSTVFGEGLVRIRVYETPTSYAEWKRS